MITAEATQDLSRFDLDLQQLEVQRRHRHRPRRASPATARSCRSRRTTGCTRAARSSTSVRYGGVPETIVGSPIVFGSPYGFLHTDDGAFMGDEPNVASTWFPVHDHPQRQVEYTFRVTVPEGLGVVANGQLMYQRTRRRQSMFVWDELDPMASYLATADIGHWLIKTGRTPGGDPGDVAVDPVLRRSASRDAVDFFYDTTAEAADLWSADVRPVSVRLDRRDRRQRDLQRPAARLLAGDPDQAGLLGRPQHRTRSPTSWRTSGSATASRWQLGQHLAQRGLRDVRRVPVGRAHRHAHGARGVPARLQPRPATSAFWQSIVADPQRDTMFASAVYRRGGMTLQALREKISDEKFFRVLKTWTRRTATATARRRSSPRWRSGSPARIWTRSSRPGSTGRQADTCRRSGAPAGLAGLHRAR